MPSCSVVKCFNNKRNSEVRFHRFPPCDEQRRIWLRLCGKPLTRDTSNFRICSAHFISSDYDPSSNRFQLMPTAIPSHKLTDSALSTVSSNHQNSTPFLNMNHTENSVTLDQENQDSTENPTKLHNRRTSTTSILCTVKYRRLKLKYDKIRIQMNTLKKAAETNRDHNIWRKKYILSNQKWAKRQDQYVITIEKLKNTILDLKSKNQKNLDKLSPVFTSLQKTVILGQKSKTQWTTDEICKGVSLRAISTRAYDLVRDVWHFPLPSRRTLQRWCSRIDCNPGILGAPLRILGELFYMANPMEKLCTLAFDEMQISPLVGYHWKTDRIIGPDRKMSLTTIRGLSGPWKLPVHFDFDYHFDYDSLTNLIKIVHQAGITVKAIVSDLSTDNQGLHKNLTVDHNKSWIRHPVTNEKVWIFADFPHMIKLLRNNLLDSGLVLSDGTVISKADFQELIDTDNSELKVAFKLTQKHLEVVGQERMRVFPAFQMFSGTVASAFKKYFPEKVRISEFIQLVNDASDILNSRLPEDKKNPVKSAFGVSFANQIKILDKFANEIEYLRVGKARTLYPFQKGTLMTVASLKGVFAELQLPPNNMKYVMTARFNQDHLENMFCIIRDLGIFYTNAPPIECINRVKSLMISLNLNIKRRGNTIVDDQAQFSSEVLSTLMDLDRDLTGEASEQEILSGYWPDEEIEIFEV